MGEPGASWSSLIPPHPWGSRGTREAGPQRDYQHHVAPKVRPLRLGGRIPAAADHRFFLRDIFTHQTGCRLAPSVPRGSGEKTE